MIPIIINKVTVLSCIHYLFTGAKYFKRVVYAGYINKYNFDIRGYHRKMLIY